MHESGNMVEYPAMSTSQGTYGQTEQTAAIDPSELLANLVWAPLLMLQFDSSVRVRVYNPQLA